MYGLAEGNHSKKTEHHIPIIGLLDKWEDFDPSTEYDFYYVDDGEVPQEDLVWRLPYQGPGLYWKGAWREEVFPRENTMKAVFASKHAPASIFKEPFAYIQICVQEAYSLEQDYVVNEQVKKALISFTGLLGKRYHYTWKFTISHSVDDRMGAIFKTRDLPDGRMELFTRTETLTNLSMLPAHLITRTMEHVYLGRGA